MDMRMPRLDGLEATRRLIDGRRDGFAAQRVVILTTFDLDEYVYAALRAVPAASSSRTRPPSGWSPRCGPSRSATRCSRRGDAPARRAVRRPAAEPVVGARRRIGSLTAREAGRLRARGAGMSNAEIADSLVVGESTVKSHVARVLSKLDLRDRAQAVVLAYESGVIRATATAS